MHTIELDKFCFWVTRLGVIFRGVLPCKSSVSVLVLSHPPAHQEAPCPIRREVDVHLGAATANDLLGVKVEARSGALLVKRTRLRATDMLSREYR